MNFGEILSKAWKIIWKFKILWLFGILASCAVQNGGGGGGSGGGGSNFNNGGGGNNGDLGRAFPGLQNLFDQLQRIVNDPSFPIIVAVIILTLCFLAIVLGLLALAVGSLGEAGLVRGVLRADEGVQKLTLSDVWNESKPYFWRVFLFNLLLRVLDVVLGLLIVIIIVLPIILITAVTLGIALICLLPLLCLLIPISILISWGIEILVRMIIIAMVSENLDIMQSVTRAWNVWKANFWPVVLMSLILGIGSFIIGIILVLPFLLVAIPLFIGLATQSQGGIFAGLAVTGVLFFLYLLVVIVLGGILEAYIWAAWVLTFRRLTGHLPVDDVPAGPTLDGDVHEQPQVARMIEEPAVETDAELPPPAATEE